MCVVLLEWQIQVSGTHCLRQVLDIAPLSGLAQHRGGNETKVQVILFSWNFNLTEVTQDEKVRCLLIAELHPDQIVPSKKQF